MKRGTLLAVAVLAALTLTVTGCSKKKSPENLQGEIARLQADLKLAEDKNKQLVQDAERAALKASEEKVTLEDAIRALQMRTMLQRTDTFKVEPFAPTENGWLIIDGEHTYTLQGYADAQKVVFFWAVPNSEPQKLGEDTNGKDGWTWRGTIPPGNMRAFFAQVHYAGGVSTYSPVLAMRSGGK